MQRAVVVTLAALWLAACTPSPGAGDAAPPAGDASAAEPVDGSPAQAAGAAAAPTTDAPAGAQAPDTPVVSPSPTGTQAPEARFDGLGPLRLGMSLAEAGQAWPGLVGASQATTRRCFSANLPASAALPYTTVMFDDGKAVRYESSSDDLQAPGGGRRGMDEVALQALYQGALQASPHRFVKGGKYLTIDASGVAPSRLVFETDASGKVSEWRVGLRPQVDYTEACESDPG